jgi:YbgC/YbaW family acyl-CoA thioester hydrolase
MDRVKIELPEVFPFKTTIAVRITDLNYGNHAGNDTYFAWMHEARMQFLQRQGFTELDFAGTALIMADAAIEYKAEVHYADLLQVEVAAGAFSRKGFTLYYRITALREQQQVLVAKAKTCMLCFDYASKKVVGLPGEVIERMKA